MRATTSPFKKTRVEELPAESLVVLRACAETFGTSIEEMRGRVRNRNIADARHAYAYLISKIYPRFSSIEIGASINRDHSTILHARKSAKSRLERLNGKMVDPDFTNKVSKASMMLSKDDSHEVSEGFNIAAEVEKRQKLMDLRERIEYRILLSGQKIKNAIELTA